LDAPRVVTQIVSGKIEDATEVSRVDRRFLANTLNLDLGRLQMNNQTQGSDSAWSLTVFDPVPNLQIAADRPGRTFRDKDHWAVAVHLFRRSNGTGRHQKRVEQTYAALRPNAGALPDIARHNQDINPVPVTVPEARPDVLAYRVPAGSSGSSHLFASE